MFTSANMGLKVWNLLTDLFDHTQLEANWAAIDTHDHTPGKGVQIPSGGIADGAITSSKLATSVTQLLVPAGAILPYGGAAAPTGFLLCQGQVESQTTYSALYTAIGSAYNTGGEGSGNFRLPNLVQRFPLGQAASGTGSTLGGYGGNIDHTHSIPSLSIPALTVPSSSVSVTVPGHSHPLSDNGGAKIGLFSNAGSTQVSYVESLTGPTITYTGFWENNFGFNSTFTTISDPEGTAGLAGNTDAIGNVNASGSTTSTSTGTGSTGSGTTGTANAPFCVVNYIIKY